jgi:hypothetical protein
MAPTFSRPGSFSDSSSTTKDDVPYVLRSVLKIVRRLLRVCVYFQKATTDTLLTVADKCGYLAALSLDVLIGLCCPGILEPQKNSLPSLMPAIIVMLIVLSIYFVFVTCYLPVAGLPVSSLQSIGFHGLTGLSFLAYYLGATTDPGGIPENDIWRSNPPPLLEKKKSSNERRFCQKELKFKPDRCHYCSPMNRNVLRMDHYCPWLVNCSGTTTTNFSICSYSTAPSPWTGAAGLCSMQSTSGLLTQPSVQRPSSSSRALA